MWKLLFIIQYFFPLERFFKLKLFSTFLKSQIKSKRFKSLAAIPSLSAHEQNSAGVGVQRRGVSLEQTVSSDFLCFNPSAAALTASQCGKMLSQPKTSIELSRTETLPFYTSQVTACVLELKGYELNLVVFQRRLFYFTSLFYPFLYFFCSLSRIKKKINYHLYVHLKPLHFDVVFTPFSYNGHDTDSPVWQVIALVAGCLVRCVLTTHCMLTVHFIASQVVGLHVVCMSNHNVKLTSTLVSNKLFSSVLVSRLSCDVKGF